MPVTTLQSALKAQLAHTLESTELPWLGTLTRGKVRDVYAAGDRLFLVATDRLSAFDKVLSSVPFKGELLTRTAVHWFEATKDIVPNHLIDVPDPNVMVAHRCEPIPVEIIVRGYLTGSLWRDLQAGQAAAYGLELPAKLGRDEAFPSPILTPTTKAALGDHDTPISREALIAEGLVDAGVYRRCEEIALALYKRGVEQSAARGLILVDTKYELGMLGGEVVLMDEVHTPDSSRYWRAGPYAERLAAGAPQAMLDKENIRQWLINTHGYQGEGEAPQIPDALRVELAAVYVQAYETLTGACFSPEVAPTAPRIERALRAAGYP